MKKSTVILLIISAVLIVTGIIFCIVGSAKAKVDGSQLFRQIKNSDGNLVETIDLSEEILNKIKINVPEAKINVYGNSDKAYVEIVNFNALDYTAYINNRALIIENDLVAAMVNRVSGGDIGYNGLRDYFRIIKTNDKKEINIYLTNKNEVKIFDFNVGEGDLVFDSVANISDYNITLANGNVMFKNIAEVSKISAKIESGNVELNSLFANVGVIEIGSGNLTLSSPKDMTYTYDLTAEMGEITVGNESYKGSHKHENEESDGSITANIEVGNIKIKFDE